jgi:uncharacterized protein with PIN domain
VKCPECQIEVEQVDVSLTWKMGPRDLTLKGKAYRCDKCDKLWNEDGDDYLAVLDRICSAVYEPEVR